MTSGPTPSPDPSIGKYHIVEPLKTGGTAAIYLAVMRGENQFIREVVIKRPLPHLMADPRLRAMFIDEAHIASRLSHPNVVQVLDLVANAEDVYLVLEFLKGRDLREILHRLAELGRPMPPEVAVWIAAEVAAGLGYAHDATGPDGKRLNIVHRDVSPKNIRITDRGAVKLIDFGIARADNRLAETAAGSVKGTLGYMSPEQILGDAIDRRSDIFAFGICLFQMLTGMNPFDGANLKERVQKLVQDPVPSLRDVDPAIHPELDRIVAKLLERDLDKRYARLQDAQRELEHHLLELRVASPRDRVVGLLEEIFPDIHDAHPRLTEALTSINSFSGKIDPSVRLLFPEEMRLSAAPTEKAVPASPIPPTPATATAESRAPAPKPPLTQPTIAERIPRKAHPGRTVAVVVAAAGFLGLAAAIALSAVRDRTETQAAGPAPVDAGLAPIAVVVPPPAAPDAASAAIPEEPPEDAGAEAPPDAGHAAKTAEPAPPPKKQLARAYLRAGAHLAKTGRTEEALLVYTLAFRASGRDVDPAVYRNIALVQKDLGNTAALRACMNMYLAARPDAPDAQRIRSLLAAYPATPSTTCVTRQDAAAAEKRAQRIGAQLDAWLAESGGP